MIILLVTDYPLTGRLLLLRERLWVGGGDGGEGFGECNNKRDTH